MSLRYYILLLFLSVKTFSQDIKLVDVIYKENLLYYHIYEKNTLSGDEFIEIHNINIMSDKKPYLTSISNCNNDYPSFYDINSNNENIISFSMLFPSQVFDCVNYNKLNVLKEKLNKYNFEKTKLIEENNKYRLFEKTINKGVFLVFSVSRNYFNGNDNQMWLYGKKKNRDITVYKLLTEEDNEWIDDFINLKLKQGCN